MLWQLPNRAVPTAGIASYAIQSRFANIAIQVPDIVALPFKYTGQDVALAVMVLLTRTEVKTRAP